MYSIGVDLGGTNIAIGIVDDNYEIVIKDSVPTPVSEGAEAIVDAIADLCLSLCDRAGIPQTEIRSVGIAAPGSVDPAEGVVKYANNLPFKDFPIAALLRRRLACQTIHVENDANAAAWGEAVAGAAKGTKDSVMITLGTGVGGGIVIDGKLYSGFNYAGAELGHMVIVADGRPCTCGRKGCFEAYSSATALIAMTEEKMAECRASGRKTLMEEIVAEKGSVSGRTAFQAARRNDPAGLEVVERYCFYLACGLTNLINIFQPEILSIGGGISNEGDYLLSRLIPIIERERYGGNSVKPTEIRIAQLKNDAGIIGGAVLA
ncbi:MAG: ROK family glucokinase [Clostridia bacterium]|nr:ROK family glucokinase [Clostridia bacterium]